MKIHNLTLNAIEEDIFKARRPCVVMFSSPACHLCINLKPILQELSEEFFKRVDFYTVNIDEEEELSEEFLGDSEGVPTGFIFVGPRAFKIADAEETDDDTWYSKKYLTNIINIVLRNESKNKRDASV